MAKSIAQKLKNSKRYKVEFGERLLSEKELYELERFGSEIGFSYDRIPAIICFINQKYSNWVEKWKQFRSVHNSTLTAQTLLYGVVKGEQRYLDLNKRKTAKMDHSHETQKARGLKSAAKSTGSKTHSIRSIGYWIKNGLTEVAAMEKVHQIQATNTIERYIKQYGNELGMKQFKQRNIDWANSMNTPEKNKKKSLGLWRYIERYGETKGKVKYLEMRKIRNTKSRLGKASNESTVALRDIIQLLDVNQIEYYFGVDGNKEWFIFDTDLERPFFYDLTIPSLSLIIESHGESFHPNPLWDAEKWANWKALFTNKSADAVFATDQYKKKLAEDAGWRVIEVYSSDHSPLNDAILIIEGRAL